MKRIHITVFLIAGFLLALAACAEKTAAPDNVSPDGEPPENASSEQTAPPEPTAPDNTVKTFFTNAENVKFLGRTWLDGENILWCALSGSGIEFEISASKLELSITGDSGAKPDNKDGNARFAVYVNGERVIDAQVDGAEKSYVVFDTQTSANVKVIKLSESANSVFGIKGITAENCENLRPADNKPLLIEFVGDSITCGYGVDDEVKENHFSTSTEDITKTYAYKTARMLNADYSMVSYSGYGIISGYSGDGQKSANSLLPKYYDKTGFSYGSANGKKLDTVLWDFSVRQPDIIVINLGTNDNSYTKNDPEKCAEYQTEYTAFLKTVREKNPGAKIICSLGIMGQELYKYIENAVSDYSLETGDCNISCFKFDVQNMAADGIAADWHPSEKTHEKAALKLADEISGMLIDTSKPAVALTFDDGPSSATLKVLEMLEKYDVTATFFVIGGNINDTTGEAMKRAFDMGCEIANHSKTHADMSKMTADDIKAEIDYTSDKVEEITGVRPKFFRPPFIAVSETMYKTIDLPFICGIGSDDWDAKNDAARRAERTLEQVGDGTIILLHDFTGNDQTVEALDTIIPSLLERGYQFVTVSRLFEIKGVTPEPNKMYSHVR